MDEVKTSFRTKQQKTSGEMEIDILRLLKGIGKKLWLIILVGVCCGALAYCYAKYTMTPMYDSSFTCYINNKNTNSVDASTNVTSADLSASRSLATTYSQIITSRSLLQEAEENAGFTYDVEWLRESGVMVEAQDDTEILEITVELPSAEDAQTLAYAIADIAPGYISGIIEGSSMIVIDAPDLPDDYSSPNYKKYAEIGLLAGAFIVALIVCIRTLVDDKITDKEELADRLGVTIMGTIPELSSTDTKKETKQKRRK